MKENEIAAVVVDAAYRLHTGLGPGIFEIVYEVLLAHELPNHGYSVERQVAVPIIWDGIRFDEGFRADLLVDDSVIVEVKSIAALDAVHSKQVLTYLRLMDKRLGLLINFGDHMIKHGIKRIANGMPEDRPVL
jgi:GxxExxY protein